MKLSNLTKRYRISLEDPQDAYLLDRDSREQIKGRHGTIYLWLDTDNSQIAIETEKALYQNRFAKIDWLKRQSWCVFTGPFERINDACKLIGAYKRRQMTPEQREKQAKILIEARKKLGSHAVKSGFEEAK